MQTMKQNNISQLRKSINTKLSVNTQANIAKKLGISQAYLSMILNGKRIPKSAIEILKKVNNLLDPNFSKN